MNKYGFYASEDNEASQFQQILGRELGLKKALSNTKFNSSVDFVRKWHHIKTIRGHWKVAFCLATCGRFAITGADDNLAKVIINNRYYILVAVLLI